MEFFNLNLMGCGSSKKSLNLVSPLTSTKSAPNRFLNQLRVHLDGIEKSLND